MIAVILCPPRSKILADLFFQDVNINCRLKTDLSQVPKSAFIFQKRPRDGLEYFELHYELQIENNPSGLMKFSLLVNDEEYSAVEATY